MIEIEEIRLAKKRIIALSNERNKPVTTATELLESMIKSVRPTRAELIDVVKAAFQLAEALGPSP